MDGGETRFRLGVVRDESLGGFLRVGSGGFGQIFRAKHTLWGTDVAVKLLHYKDGSASSAQREAQLMFDAGNQNVVRVLGVYEGRVGDPQRPLQCGLVLEFLARGSLEDLLQRLAAPLPRALALRMALQVSLGMNFLHQLTPPILHLDLKPSNVLLSDSLDAKITDFGLSRVAESVCKYTGMKDEDEGGTLCYMPPEALQSSSYKPSKAFDVYSFGILLWSIITGKEPYDGVQSSLVRFRIPLGDRPDLASVDRCETEGLDELLKLMMQCWDQEPHRRPSFLDCVHTITAIYTMHERRLNDAVHDVLEQLQDDEICSSLKSVQISRKPHREVDPQGLSCVTGPAPQQETAAAHTKTVQKECSPRAAPLVGAIRKTQRQTSNPGVQISMSSVYGVQIGNNNSMNIIRKPRQRHRTAPSAVNTHSSYPQNPLQKHQ